MSVSDEGYSRNVSCALNLIKMVLLHVVNLNNIYFGNNQTIQYIKHSNYIQDSETSNYAFINLSPRM